VSFPWSTVITGVIAFAGIGYGAHLSGKRETLNWTRDQRLKAYVELLTAIDKCYGSFKELAEIMKELGYPADIRDHPRARSAIDNWNKWYDEIDRCLAFADLVGSERFIEYRPRVDYGWRSYQMALIADVVQGKPTRQEEWESVSGRTRSGERSVRETLRGDLGRIDSFGQRVSDALWPLRRRFRRMYNQLRRR
jgi:hypothetical protein